RVVDCQGPRPRWDGRRQAAGADPRLVLVVQGHRGDRVLPLASRLERRLSGLAVALAVLGGLAGSVQVAGMGRFGGRVGVFVAPGVSTGIQLVRALGVVLAVRGGLGGLHHVGRTPVGMWAGGLMGFPVVTAITFAQPRIGATAVIGILIAGQLVMGALIDRFGLFGVDQIAISWPRALGVVLLGAGAALSLAR